MRIFTLVLATVLLLAAGAAGACPYTNASRDQNLASANSGPSTPMPPKSAQGNNG